MTTTLIEAHERFAAALDDLRGRAVDEFDHWLDSALGQNLATAQMEADERSAAMRSQFADDFLDRRAPQIIRSFNPEAEFDILKALRSYEARPEQALRPLAIGPERPWLRSLWRVVLAAAFGAVAGVILVALQPIGDAPIAEPSITREAMVLRLLAAAFAAALGAAIGVFVLACPPLRVLLERFGLKGVSLKIAKAFGGTLLLLRLGAIIVLAAALLSGFFTLLAWLLGGSRPLHVVIGLTALATVLAARLTAPDAAAGNRDAIHRAKVAKLDSDLRSDTNVWAALSAALVLKRNDGGGTGPDVNDVVNIILSRRAQHESSDGILQVIEQHLGLPCGTTASTALRTETKIASEFKWQPEDAQVYTTFGIVEIGDLVSVSTQPLYIEDVSGGKRVTRKGVVARKRRA